MPARAWTVGTPYTVDPRLEQVNREALTRADALLALLPAGQASVGVPREIEQAKALGIPWAVVTDLVGSFSLADCENTFRLSRIGVEEAIRWITSVPERLPGSAAEASNLVFAKMDGHDGILPTRAHAGDAGWDLYASEHVTIPPGEFRDVPCGVRVALPAGVWARVVGRSSTVRNRKLLLIEGTIDEGYRGPMFSGVWNLSADAIEVKPGERLAQMILMSNESARYRARWASATEFAGIPHDGRGENAFGSTGV